jgi:hypothetical protein
VLWLFCPELAHCDCGGDATATAPASIATAVVATLNRLRVGRTWRIDISVATVDLFACRRWQQIGVSGRFQELRGSVTVEIQIIGAPVSPAAFISPTRRASEDGIHQPVARAETNPLLPLCYHDPKSKTPAAKSIPVFVRAQEAQM